MEYPDLEPWLDNPSDQWDELPAGPEYPYERKKNG
jgi:hypothetical protein